MKKILFFLLLFVNLHVFIANDGLQFHVGTTASAQHMYTEGQPEEPHFHCTYCRKEFDK